MGAVSAARCPSPAAAVAGVPTPTPALRGDVDGDGEPDASFTLHGQPRDCNYLVVDSTASGRVGVRIPRPDLDDPLAPGVPSVTVLARISPLPGAAIVVTFGIVLAAMGAVRPLLLRNHAPAVHEYRAAGGERVRH